jgi:taurine dioxygenase
LQLEKAAGALGAFVSGVSLADAAASATAFTEIRAALLEHQVLFLRDQAVSGPEFQAFARRFGQVETHPAYSTLEDAPDVQILESTPEAPSKIELWHTDMTFRPTPPAITALHGQIIPAFGGDTLWASTAAAYEGLSEPFRRLVDELEAEHDFRHGFQESLAEPGGAERLADAIAANPPVRHPVVAEHPETGRRVLYVNPLFTTRILGLTRLESRSLLEFLCRHVTTEEFTVRLSWKPGTVAIWDNRSTQHKPVNDFFPQHRRMHRVTIAGDRPRRAA